MKKFTCRCGEVLRYVDVMQKDGVTKRVFGCHKITLEAPQNHDSYGCVSESTLAMAKRCICGAPMFFFDAYMNRADARAYSLPYDPFGRTRVYRCAKRTWFINASKHPDIRIPYGRG